jgi:hypothetical protein
MNTDLLLGGEIRGGMPPKKTAKKPVKTAKKPVKTAKKTVAKKPCDCKKSKK